VSGKSISSQIVIFLSILKRPRICKKKDAIKLFESNQEFSGSVGVVRNLSISSKATARVKYIVTNQRKSPYPLLCNPSLGDNPKKINNVDQSLIIEYTVPENYCLWQYPLQFQVPQEHDAAFWIVALQFRNCLKIFKLSLFSGA